MSGCSSACGYCGRCTDAWEGPEPEFCVSCVSCSRDFYVLADERPPFRCPDCLEMDAARSEGAV
jgi:hypothetical protein